MNVKFNVDTTDSDITTYGQWKDEANCINEAHGQNEQAHVLVGRNTFEMLEAS